MILVAVISSSRSLGDDVHSAGAIELRADQFEIPLDFSSDKPCILTLRPKRHGGAYEGPEQARLMTLAALARIHRPAFVDIEHDVPVEWIQDFQQTFAGKIIRSYHNFTETPADLAAIVADLTPHAAIVKLATFAQTTNDGLRMLRLVRGSYGLVAGHCMGELGQFSRILGPAVGSALVYASREGDIAAPGSVDIAIMRDLYRIHMLNPSTEIYALIGSPVDHSRGHVYHNRAFAASGSNRVYVKCDVVPDQLAQFFAQIQDLNFQGLSVTMPLKEAVVELVAGGAPGFATPTAFNTMRRRDQGWEATNTDGLAVRDALQETGRQIRRVLVIGAGGSAQAIISVLARDGVAVFVVNRSQGRAAICARLGATPASLDTALSKTPFDAVISAIPGDGLDPRRWEGLLASEPTVIDLNYRSDSKILALARRRKCPTIDGETIFERQAALQQAYWSKKLFEKPQLQGGKE